jgi:serine/threonine protein kinase
MEKLGAGDPQRIGAYRLLARLGAGGMGHVYLARSDRGRTVAVKLVREDLAAQEEFRARFRQEVRAARRVGGHWTAPVLDADTEAEVPWVATGYVAGPSLQQVVGRDHGALPERSVRILAAGLAHALQDIHAAGIVHRDLKPSNVLVTIDGPRVIDFGIARALETQAGDGLTRTGSLVGSPGFMAPEQVRGDRVTPASDVFCLGSVLAYAATGTLPFGSSSSGVHALMFRIAQEEPDLSGVPEGIADLVRDCLRKDPATRPTLHRILDRTGAEDTVSGGRSRDPWLPGTLVAQLGRHAVQLLDTEDPEVSSGAPPQAPSGAGPRTPAPQTPEGLISARPAFEDEAVQADSGGLGAAAPRDGKGEGGGGEEPPGPPEAAPEHAPTPDGPTPPPPGTPGGAPFDHLPTMTTGLPGTPPPTAPPGGPPGGPQGSPPAGPPVHPAYGYPQQHPQPAAYGYPHYQHQPAGYPPPPGATPPYGPTPPYAPTPPYGPGVHPQPGPPPERGGRSTAVLIIVALIVALGAGASVYALMKGDGDNRAAGGDPTTSPTATATAPAPGPATEGPTQPPTTPEETPTDGAIPVKYLGTWTASIDNATGHNTRELTVQQGEVGDTVLSLTADGPAGSGTYHCVFRAELSEAPSAGGPLRIGASEVTVGQPATSCSPGEATELTVLPDGRLRRVNTSSGDELTYTKQG